MPSQTSVLSVDNAASQRPATGADGAVNPRLIQVYDAMRDALRKVVVEQQVTHQEYCLGVEFLNRVAAAGEINLICDFIFEAAVMEAHFASSKGTAFNAEGPYYLAGAPRLTAPYVMPMKGAVIGDPLVFSGSVRDLDGKPLPGALIEFWHSTADGLYSNIDPEVPEWNFRAQFDALEDGTFDVRTILPCPYEISKTGPVGDMQTAMGRHKFRPAHLHLKVTYPGKEPLTTQIYFSDDPYVDSDAANCVHKSLVVPLEDVADPAQIARYGTGRPYVHAHFDFILSPAL
ncbi:dioxygenase family protein [Paraburkholderia caffeinilytica]|uniref:dioxygenase family protein n=1 Tax=Paraburkholderia caffeinilytica TaxID=1761016 RepID=UPI0038BC1EAD